MLTESQHEELIIRDTFLQSETDLRQYNGIDNKGEKLVVGNLQPAIISCFKTKSGKPPKKTVIKQP